MDYRAEIDRFLFAIFLLRESFDKASEKQVRNKSAELDKLENYIKSSDLGPRALLEVRNRILELTEYAKNISQDEGKTASAQMYTPMNQTPKAEGNDWNRMAQVAKTTSESGNIDPNPQSEIRYGRFHEQEEMPSPYNAQNSSVSHPSDNIDPNSQSMVRYGRFHEQQEMPSSYNAQNSLLSHPSGNIDPYSQSEIRYGRFHEQQEMSSPYNASSRGSRSSNFYHQEVHAQMQSPMVQSVLNTGVDRNRVKKVIEKMLRETGNTYPNAEALMNAVLNYEQNREASSSHHQGPPQNPQTDERRNTRRRSRSSSHQEESRQAHAYMQSPMVQSVLNTGVDRDRVKNVIERRLRDRGNTYPNAEVLMNAVLNYEQNRGEFNTSSSRHQGPPQNPQTDERCNARTRSRSSASSNAFPNAEAPMNAIMNFGQRREVLNTPSSHDQKPPVIPQNAPQSHSPSTEGRSSRSQNPDLEQVVSELRQKTKCKVCLDSELEVMFQPCNHLCCCLSCGLDERVETCPVCRSPIESRVRTLIP